MHYVSKKNLSIDEGFFFYHGKGALGSDFRSLLSLTGVK